ncbi:MAG TPA: Gfo/Idh/MocA family oxidoreductase [Chloroflexota bacterium]|nr:Gfo/Idh/MocA family oxidoreductase [Chloroflexota bacterium]
MEQIRAAIVGSGGMAHTRAAHLSQTEGASIVCVSSRNPVTGPPLADRHGATFIPNWQDAIGREDVNCVVVATHNDSHAQVALAALEAGKHVLVEYPLATSLEDADRLIRLSEAQSRVLHVGHDQALVGWHVAIKDAAATLGPLRAVNGVLATPSRGGGRSLWRNLHLSGPPFMVGIAYVHHLIDLFGPVDWVEGTSTYDDLDDAGYYRSSVSTLTAGFKRGGVAQLLYIRGFAVPRDEQEQAMMFGNGFLSYRGYVSGNRTNEGHLTRVTHNGAQRLDFPSVTLAQASRINTERFVKRVRGAPDDGSTQLAREAVAVALGADEAARGNQRITLH